MGVLEPEIDFPRGGAVVSLQKKKSSQSGKFKSSTAENQLFGRNKKRRAKSNESKAEETPSKKRKVEGKAIVWNKPVTQKHLTDGVMGLGVVTEIYGDYVLLETAYSCRVKLPATQISKKFTELLKSEKVSLDSTFVVGQMVPFRVVERSTQTLEKKRGPVAKKKNSEILPIVTCDPSKLNAHLTPLTLMPGLVLHAIVASHEEKGVVMDIGLQSIHVFLPTEKQQGPLDVGQPVIVRVDSLKTSRVVIVSSYVEQGSLCLEACEKLVLNDLMPGTVIECVPDAAPSVAAGVYVTLGNGVRGFVSKSHLPPRLRRDITKVGRSLRCVVMFCQQNTPLLVLSAHPDILAISKPIKRSSFLGYSIGDCIKGEVIDVIPSKFFVCLSLPVGEDGKVPLLVAVSYKQFLKKQEALESFYTIGSEHVCRIVNFRIADRCVVVSDRKEILSQKFVSYKDAVPGEIVSVKVTDVHPRGVQVAVSEIIKGFIPLDQVADKKVALEKAFTVGSHVKCRVWLVNEKKKQIWLTARPSLVNYKGTLVSSYNSKYEGVVTVGIVVKILQTGGVIVQFFGAVRGLLSANEVNRTTREIRQGVVLEVRIVSVNASDEKMTLVIADESTCIPRRINNPQPVNFDSDGKKVFTAVVDEVCKSESSVGGRRSEKVLLHLESNASVKGYLMPIHFSDFLDSPLESMGVLCNGSKLSSVACLGAVGGFNRFISKRFVCTWLEYFKSDVPKCFDDLKPHQLVCGIIYQRVPDKCLYVEIAGGSGLLGKVAFEDIDGGKDGAYSLQLGQAVVGRIRSIHTENKAFRLSLKLTDCVPREHLPSKAFSPAASLALQLVRSCVEEMQGISRLSDAKLPGTTVISTISQIVDDVLLVTFDSKFTGRVRKGNYTDGVKVGDKIKCLVIDYLFPLNDAELVMVDNAHKSSVMSAKSKKNIELANRVVLIRRDYIVILPSEKDRLIFIPSRLHPNQVIEMKNLRVSHGDQVDIGYTIAVTDVVYIGLLKEDVALIDKLMPASRDLPKSFPKKKSTKLRDGFSKKSKSDGDGVSKRSKSDLSVRTKSVKNLCTYTGTVVGPWASGDRRDHGKLAAEVELPGGQIGRLHVSELPSRFLVENTSPLEVFIKKNRRRSVIVKIIKFFSIRKGDAKIRVAELTMAEMKISETRKKATAVAFQTVFTPGEILRCFISPDQDLTKKKIRVEVNPLWSGQIAIEASSEDLKIEAPDRDGEVFEYLPKTGEMRLAKVLSVVKLKKSHGFGLLNLALDMSASVRKFDSGQRVTARVINVNLHPLSVQFQLPNGQQATLCATAIANNYEKVTKHITHFQRNGIFHLYALRQDDNPQRNYVCTEGRYESYLKQKEANEYSEGRRLLVDRSEVVVGLTYDGFLAKHTAEAALVEIGPGIVGRLRKLRHPEIMTLALNSIISVRVRRIDGQGRISLSLVKIVSQVSAVKERKRKVDKADYEVVKKEKKEKSAIEEVDGFTLNDPGFDWSNVGFRPEDLAAVGKIGDCLGNDSLSAKPGSSANNLPNVAEPKEETVMDSKPLSKEEQDMEKERALVTRETELSGDFYPETQEDFARLLRKDPNSAEIWIRYISFFLEKNDLNMARATAERALTVINYREEAEIFNIWTAFLNMEVAYGDENSAKEVFQRSCGNADAFKMHKQMAAIFSDAGKIENADEVYEMMLKKFRADSDDVWTLYGEHLMKTDRTDKARDLMKRALTSVPKQRHVPIISRFAQMEFRKGDVERGRTLFESLVTAYPKKTDLWLVYADLSLKHSGVEMARQVLERACSLQLSMHKLRPLFRKWMELEERFGDDKSRMLLRAKAEKFLEMNIDDDEDIV